MAHFSIIGIFRRTETGNDDQPEPFIEGLEPHPAVDVLDTRCRATITVTCVPRPDLTTSDLTTPTLPSSVFVGSATGCGALGASGGLLSLYGLASSPSLHGGKGADSAHARLHKPVLPDVGISIDTPAMVTCESNASLAATPPAFSCESLATGACESSAATSDIVACESAAAVASPRPRHPPPSPASPRLHPPPSPASPRSLSPARPRPPSPASHVRDQCEHPLRTRLP